MRTHTLLRLATEPAALAAAWERVRGKGAAGGADNVSVTDFATRADRSLATLGDELRAGTYVPQPLREIAIPKGGKKRGMRTLHLPAVRDKIAQEAVRVVVQPILERRFLNCSYGYREGKGPARAIARVNHYLTAAKRRWVATADIDDFFASLDQRQLIAQVERELGDPAIVRLVDLWCRMGAIRADGEWRDATAGVHQGNVLSPLLANLYLHPFDEEMTRRRAGLVRYADDFIVMCTSRAEADEVLQAATGILRERLSLRLNDDASPIAPVDEGFTFLGIRFQGVERSIAPAKLEKARATLARVADRAGSVDFSATLKAHNESALGWRRYYGTVLPRPAVEPLDRIAIESLGVSVSAALRGGRISSWGQAASKLGAVEFVSPRSLAERRLAVLEILKASKAAARQSAAAARAGESAATPIRHASKPAKARAPRAQSPARAVSARKRAYQRESASTSALIVSTPGSFVGKQGELVVVRHERKTVARVRVREPRSITISSPAVTLSAALVEHCARHGVSLLFTSHRAELNAALAVPAGTDADVGVHQLGVIARVRPALEIARRFVDGKIRNQLNLLKYLHKYRKDADGAHAPFASAFDRCLAGMQKLREELRGLPLAEEMGLERGRLMSVEGRAAAHYWEMIGLALADNASFPGRERRGATDLVNAMLNYGYAILESRVYLAVSEASLLPHAGFLHSVQPGKTPLVYDLMEEFRPQAVDRTVVAMLNRGEEAEVDGKGMLTDPTRKRLAARVLERLASLVRFREQEVTLENVIRLQARSLAKHVRGEGAYRAFVAGW